MIRNLSPIRIMFFYVFFCDIIKVNHFLHYFIILLHLVSSFLHIKYLNVSIESIDWILLSLLALNVILNSSLNTWCFLLLNLFFIFNINLLLFISSVWFSLKISLLTSFFLNSLFYFQCELLLNNFYNLQI